MFRTLTCAAAAVFMLAACDEVPAQKETINGTVYYRERMALPPDANVNVALIDVSHADAAAVTLAETNITPGGQVPVPFTLEFDPAQKKQGSSYALQARITSGDELLFITQTMHPALTGGNDSTDILVQRVVN